MRSPWISFTEVLFNYYIVFRNAQSPKKVILGVCAMDIKARSKAMREILTRLVERAKDAIEVKVFGDKAILDEGPIFK